MLNKTENKNFRDEQTEKRIYEHLHNKNDVITDADIHNVKTDLIEEEAPLSEESPEDVLDEIDREQLPVNKTIEDNTGPRIPASVNVLEE